MAVTILFIPQFKRIHGKYMLQNRKEFKWLWHFVTLIYSEVRFFSYNVLFLIHMQVFKLNKLYSQLKTFVVKLFRHKRQPKNTDVTSHRWPIIGASAQECSAFSPMVPFLKMIRLKVLSNHLKKKQRIKWVYATYLYNLWSVSQSCSVPPVVALSMEKGLGVTVQRLDFVGGIVTLLGFIKGYDKSSLFYGIQRLLVLTTAEVRVASRCPRSPTENRKCITKKIDISL